MQYKIEPKVFIKPNKEPWEKDEIRYIIVDAGTNKLLDDANGYGYKTKQSAIKSAWYKYDGGKQKVKETTNFWDKNKEIKKYIEKLYEYNMKEIALKEYGDKDIINEVKIKFGIEITKGQLKGLNS
jgi:hypothetical protein